MAGNRSKASGAGLERSCMETTGNWLRSTDAQDGIEYLEAWLQGAAYNRHRHDTYAVCLTTAGVQMFHYRGNTEVSLPGNVVVLHPDEVHDGRAGTGAGFGYRILYIEPALIFEAVRTLCGRPCALPFVRAPVATNRRLAAAITSAFQSVHEPLAADSLILQVAEGLLELSPNRCRAAGSGRLDLVAVERTRQFLDAEQGRVVRSAELEAITGLTRYDLSRQFRAVCGTSPYRYSLMRRLAAAREQIAQRQPLAYVALETGFADQAHLTRMFKAAYGMTPAQYGALHSQQRPRSSGAHERLNS